jgi:predicted phage terminase large subunit-like protein
LKPRLARLLTSEVQRRRRDETLEQLPLLSWGKRFLPHHCERPFSALHQWLAGELDQADRQRGRKVNLIGPRGAAKSTIATLVYPLRCLCRASEPYIWIVSDTKSQAETHLENLREELRSNEELHAAYGAGNLQRRGLWAAGKIQLASGVICESYGTGQRIRGRRRGASRPTLIICDDLQNDAHIYSPLQRSSSRAWFQGTLLKAGRAHTNVVNVGTALHREALAVELMQAPGWHANKFEAIRQWPTRMDLWSEWEAIYSMRKEDCATLNNDSQRAGASPPPAHSPFGPEAALQFFKTHEAEMLAGAEVLWPSEEPLYRLMQMRAEEGHTAFEREKQNSPIDPERCEWPEDYFDERIWYRDKPAGTLKALVLDPAAGNHRTIGDYSAWVLLEADANGMFYVDAELAREPVDKCLSRGVRLALLHRPHAIGIEATAFQAVLAVEWRRQATVAGVHLPPQLIHNADNKLLRIRRLGPALAQHRLRFNAGSWGAREVVNQLRDFPIGDHEDGPDALEMAFRLLGELRGGSPAGISQLPLQTR